MYSTKNNSNRTKETSERTIPHIERSVNENTVNAHWILVSIPHIERTVNAQGTTMNAQRTENELVLHNRSVVLGHGGVEFGEEHSQ